jgi:hypothetical protein
VTMGDAKGTGEGGLKIKSTKPSITERITRDRFPNVLKPSGRSGRLSLYSASTSLRWADVSHCSVIFRGG